MNSQTKKQQASQAYDLTYDHHTSDGLTDLPLNGQCLTLSKHHKAQIIATFESPKMLHPENLGDMMDKIHAEMSPVEVRKQLQQHELQNELQQVLSPHEWQQYQTLGQSS